MEEQTPIAETAQTTASRIDERLDELARNVDLLSSSHSADASSAKKSVQLMGCNVGSARVMVVDDEPINIKLVRKYLQEGGFRNFVATTDSMEVVDLVRRESPDVLLLDIVMPDINGIEVLRHLRADPTIEYLPVIILTASTDRTTKLESLEAGATDIVNKPVDPAELVPRIRNALVVKAHHNHLKDYTEELEAAVQQRTADLEMSRLEVVHCLARAAEFRDDCTGQHVARVGRYAATIGRQLGMSEKDVSQLELAAQLHDVGKIGIPDSVLLKEGKLDPEEFERVQQHCGFGKRVFERQTDDDFRQMKRHSQLGENLLDAARSPLIQMASRIALTHHERWDGNGYPLGLAGEDIPLEGRITAVADVFDALSSRRPYKPPFPCAKCFAILEEGRGTQFDSTILDAFFQCRDQIIAIQIECSDAQ